MGARPLPAAVLIVAPPARLSPSPGPEPPRADAPPTRGRDERSGRLGRDGVELAGQGDERLGRGQRVTERVMRGFGRETEERRQMGEAEMGGRVAPSRLASHRRPSTSVSAAAGSRRPVAAQRATEEGLLDPGGVKDGNARRRGPRAGRRSPAPGPGRRRGRPSAACARGRRRDSGLARAARGCSRSARG